MEYPFLLDEIGLETRLFPVVASSNNAKIRDLIERLATFHAGTEAWSSSTETTEGECAKQGYEEGR